MKLLHQTVSEKRDSRATYSPWNTRRGGPQLRVDVSTRDSLKVRAPDVLEPVMMMLPPAFTLPLASLTHAIAGGACLTARNALGDESDELVC